MFGGEPGIVQLAPPNTEPNNMKRQLTLLLVAGLAFGASAQKMKMVSGNFNALKGEKTVDLQFTYDNMRVGKYAEADYLEKKKTEYNGKEPGKGDKFVKSWNDDRRFRFEPKFEELFNDKGPITGMRGEESKYTFVINTSFTEPGYNIGVSKMPASINAEVKLIEKESGNQLGQWEAKGVPGSQFGGYDFDTGSRLAESYAKLAKELRKYLEKNVFKK